MSNNVGRIESSTLVMKIEWTGSILPLNSSDCDKDLGVWVLSLMDLKRQV